MKEQQPENTVRDFMIEWCSMMGRKSKDYYAAMDDDMLQNSYEQLLMQESRVMKGEI